MQKKAAPWMERANERFWEFLGDFGKTALIPEAAHQIKLSIPLKASQKIPLCRTINPVCHSGYYIPQPLGWSKQMRDFGKFWEILGNRL